jgi:hypothetical protein
MSERIRPNADKCQPQVKSDLLVIGFLQDS